MCPLKPVQVEGGHVIAGKGKRNLGLGPAGAWWAAPHYPVTLGSRPSGRPSKNYSQNARGLKTRGPESLCGDQVEGREACNVTNHVRADDDTGEHQLSAFCP